MTVVAAVVVALGLPARASPDRVVTGNAAGTLVVMIEVHGHRALVGAGPTRSHAADFVGRSTRPWDRHIDLLLLPGWDDRHVTGAIGLIERHEVSGIAVIGLPGTDPLWTLLEREAQWRGIEVRFLDGDHRLEIDRDAMYTLVGLTESAGAGGALVRLDTGGKRIDVIDSDRNATLLIDRANDGAGSAHVSIMTRPIRQPATTGSTLTVRPEPFLGQEFQPVDSRFIADLARNDRVAMRLDEDSIRVPLDRVSENQP
jgi:hypothetical protein